MCRRSAEQRTAVVWDAWRAAAVRAAWLRQREERLKAVARYTHIARAVRLWQDFADEQRHVRALAAQLAQRIADKQACNARPLTSCSQRPKKILS
jgi:metal-responsive CopG/Arc/MetJ family transcriptional regulator